MLPKRWEIESGHFAATLSSSNMKSKPWRLFQINLRTLLWLVVVASVGTAWYCDRSQLSTRISELESTSTYNGWAVTDALGKPDEMSGTGAKAWCPASESGKREWIELGYDRCVRPTTILIHETYATGAVDKVSIFDWWGNEIVVWSGNDPTPPGRLGLLSIPVSNTVATKRVKVYLDCANATGWNCIDAVGLQHSDGKKHWASSAKASSSYSPRTTTSQGYAF